MGKTKAYRFKPKGMKCFCSNFNLVISVKENFQKEGSVPRVPHHLFDGGLDRAVQTSLIRMLHRGDKRLSG